MVVGEFTQETQLVVIGGGPGGYSTAFRAAELGIETVLVDSRDGLGGVCLHEGCIPSKTLLHITETIENAKRAEAFGVSFDQPRIDLDGIRAWLDTSVTKLAGGLKQLCKHHGVEHIQGAASFEDSRRLNVRDSAIPRIRFRRAVIATGSTPLAHPAMPFDGHHVLTPHEAVKLPSVPKSLLVVGGNYNAVELACIYAALGSSVTLVHDGERLLENTDADLLRPLLAALKGRLTQICVAASIEQTEVKDDALHVQFTGDNTPSETRFDRAIVSIGYRANVQSLNVQATGIKLDDAGFIATDDQQRTDDPRIFAVGDVSGGGARNELLADRALVQGRVAAEVIAGWNSHLDLRAVPVTVFTDPQIAWCGLNEQLAKQNGIPYEVVRQPWAASGRAVGMGRTDGVTKMLIDPDTQLILGMGIAGPNASELIGEGALAIEMGAVVSDLAAIVHPHPTLSEMYASAAQRIENDNGNP